MKTASMVLGIIGGVIAIGLAILCLVGGLLFSPAGEFAQTEIDRAMEEDFSFDKFEVTIDDELVFSDDDFDEFRSFYPSTARYALGIAAGTLIIFAVLFFIGGILGIIGAAIVKRSHVAAGVLQLIAAFVGFVSFILFLIGGILALSSGDDQTVSPPPVVPEQ